MKRLLAAASLVVAALALPTVVAAQGTLQKVKDRGQVRCGASQGVAGFSMPDAQGNWTGFDTDFCRALAAAIFDDPKKVQLISLSSKDRLTAPERQAYSYDGNGTFEGALAYDHLGPDARQRL